MEWKDAFCLFIILIIIEIGTCYTISSRFNQCYSNFNFATCKNISLSEVPKLDRDIESLDLSFNEFITFPNDWSWFNNLVSLNLSYNKLESINSPIRNLENLERLDLSNNRFSTWRYIDLTAFQKTKLRFLDLSYNALHNSPEYHQLDINSLEILSLKNCSIKVLNNNILQTLPNILELHVSENPLTLINSTLTSRSLKYLDLSRCNLKLIEKSAIANLRSLETLLLYQNVNLKKFSCDSDSLLYLDLYHCNLETVPSGSMPSVETANFRLNHFRMISNNSFSKFSKLIQLDLSDNGLSEIEPAVFKELGLLQKLDLSMNRLHFLNNMLLTKNKQLVDLNLSYNYFTKVPFFFMDKLETLDLSKNEIVEIGQQSLSGLPRLKNLNLSKTEISVIPDYLESSSLESLDLSECNIKSVNNKTFAKMDSLRKLNLSGNRLTTTYPQCFENIITLDITENQWRCDCDELKEMYDWLAKTGKDTQSLVCDSPSVYEGLPWKTVCEVAWQPDVRKDSVWWYTSAIIVAMFVILFVILVIRRIFQLKEKRLRAQDQQRRSEEREALRRMVRAQAEYRDREEAANAPEPRESHPPSYNEALLLPKLDASHPSLAGSLHSLASKQSLSNSTNDMRSRPRRKRRRRKSNASEGHRASRNLADSDSSTPEPEPRPTLESDF